MDSNLRNQAKKCDKTVAIFIVISCTGFDAQPFKSQLKEKNLPEIPQSMIIPAKAFGYDSKISFYNYCQEFHQKINNFLFLSMIDTKYKNNFSKRKNSLGLIVMSNGGLKSQMRILSNDKSNDFLCNFLRIFCKEKKIKLTPMSVVLAKSSVKFHQRLQYFFGGIDYFWLHLMGYLHDYNILQTIKIESNS